MPTYTKIGKLVAVHGVKGELILQHSLGKKTSLPGLQAIFIEEKKNSFLPWFLESSKSRSPDEILIRLEGVHTREAAMKFLRKEVWFTAPDAIKFVSKASPVSLLGYELLQGKKKLGPILELIEQPQQLIGRLEISGHEVLIPLNPDTIVKIMHSKKQVLVDLPEGLLDIYLPST
ncbi:MAG TPA: hypothetical protein VLJ68_07545 [Chitinophagaceae bacterium]|nr:hypothetical protein [Chitinophagaceae bacterium]